MKSLSFKRSLAFVVTFVILLMAFSGCTKSDSPQTSTPSTTTPAAQSETTAKEKPVEKTKVTFWYLWKGTTIEIIDKLAAEYNAKSDKYVVEALSVPDSQKIMAAISANNGPDVTDDFGKNIGKFVSAGIMEPLDAYISETKYDIADFIPASISACKMDGKIYALPCNASFSGLFYNKTLLKEAGYSEPPKTMEELYEMAVKTTKVNPDGTIDVCGFPDFPKVYYTNNFAAASGGGWYTEDCKPASADNYGNRFALQIMRDYREKFGFENVVRFQSSGKYLDPTDPFLMGKQTFRIDGPWLGKNIKEKFKVDIDYGVTFIPYPKDKPELAERANLTVSIMFMPSNAKNKDGAFDFLSYFVSKEGQLGFTLKQGDFPSRLSVLSTDEFKKGYDVDFFTRLANSKNLVTVPNGPKNGEYNTIVDEQVELCFNFKQDIDTTLKNIYEKGTALYK
jgi:multiple sugar transport system substrate-binding protein